VTDPAVPGPTSDDGPWDPTAAGVLRLPSGRLVRGRGLRDPLPDGPAPQLGVYLHRRPPSAAPWDALWVRWPDFRLPADPAELRSALDQALERAGSQRVEIACTGGTGRTGTALACLAVLDGVDPAHAVDFVRARYRRRAVETPGQRRFVARFGR
jgi:hypothetical protein